MKQRLFSHNASTRGFSVAVSSELMICILNILKDTFIRPETQEVFGKFRNFYSKEVAEFSFKLSPLALNKRLYHKNLLGAKITFYYEDED